MVRRSYRCQTRSPRFLGKFAMGILSGEGGWYHTGSGAASARRWRSAAAWRRCRGECAACGRMHGAAVGCGGCEYAVWRACRIDFAMRCRRVLLLRLAEACLFSSWGDRSKAPPCLRATKPACDLSCSRGWAARAQSNLATRTHPKEQRTCLIEAPNSVFHRSANNSVL